jgi:ligand-binding sensor domain-containing protein
MVITIHKAKNGRLFFGTSDHGVDIMNHGRIRNINTSNGLTSNFVWSITEDVAGRIYLATYDGGICILENDHIIDTLNTEDGLTNDYLISAYCDPNGILYFGLDNGGVFQVENGRLISQKALLPGLKILRPGMIRLPSATVYHIIQSSVSWKMKREDSILQPTMA